MSGEVVHLKGAGVVWTFTRPLSPEIEKQLLRHELVQVNEDGTPWVDSETGEPPAMERPADSALKGAWVGYAVWKSEQMGAPIDVNQADAQTKADLIATYGAQDPAPAQVQASTEVPPPPPGLQPPADPTDPPAPNPTDPPPAV